MIGVYPAWSIPLLYGFMFLALSYCSQNLTVLSTLSAICLISMSVFRRVHIQREKEDYLLSKNAKKDRWIKCLFLLASSVFQFLCYLFTPTYPYRKWTLFASAALGIVLVIAVIGTLLSNYLDRIK